MLRFVDFEISENFVICSFSDFRVLRVSRFWDFAFLGFRFFRCFQVFVDFRFAGFRIMKLSVFGF